MVKMFVELNEDENRKLEMIKAYYGIASKTKALIKILNECDIEKLNLTTEPK